MGERQEEREKEGGELEERTEEGTEERIEDTVEGLEVTEEACKEDERCEEESESHSEETIVCATFTDCQEHAIVEFVKEHPELYKEHGLFHNRGRRLSGQKSLQNCRIMASSPSLAKPQGRPRDSPGSTSRWVSQDTHQT